MTTVIGIPAPFRKGGEDMNGQMDIFDFLKPEPMARFTEKACAATLKKCDCYCGYEKCCQRCTEKCTHRCGYSRLLQSAVGTGKTRNCN